jgi:hypothetical protein
MSFPTPPSAMPGSKEITDTALRGAGIDRVVELQAVQAMNEEWRELYNAEFVAVNFRLASTCSHTPLL